MLNRLCKTKCIFNRNGKKGVNFKKVKKETELILRTEKKKENSMSAEDLGKKLFGVVTTLWSRAASLGRSMV